MAVDELLTYPQTFAFVTMSDWSMRLAVGALIAILLLGAVVIAATRKWRESDGSLTPNANEQLAQFRTLYEEGALSEEEFRKIKLQLSGQIRQDMKIPSETPKPSSEESKLEAQEPDSKPAPNPEPDDRIQGGEDRIQP